MIISLEIHYLQDLLEFEFLELEMFMQHYESCEVGDFSLDKKYEFSPFSQVRTFEYPIHHPEFDTHSDSFEKGQYSVLFYYDKKLMKLCMKRLAPLS